MMPWNSEKKSNAVRGRKNGNEWTGEVLESSVLEALRQMGSKTAE